VISLSSEINGEIRVESKSANAAALIGFADIGGNDELVSGALTVTTQAAAERALTAIDSALETISLNRADLGAFQNRLEASVNNLTTTSTNMSAARSQMLDADYAAETTALTKAQVVQQAATAMLAQANQSSQAVLSLLQ
jgi:Flagellin and related hook-associated proteins